MVEHLRQTGEKHDNLQMRHFNPAHQVVVKRPEADSDEGAETASGQPHRWRTQR